MPRVFLLALVLIASHSPSQGANSPFQENWHPNRYRVVCDDPSACILDESVHSKAEGIMPDVVSTIRSMGFAPPRHWGARSRHGTPEEHLALYESAESTIAAATADCGSQGLAKSWIRIGTEFPRYDDRDHLLFYFAAHELFHVLMYERKAFLQTCGTDRRIPGWIYEGAATAVGQAATRKRYPGKFPEQRDERVARNFSGLRQYDKPLPDRKWLDGEEQWTGDEDSYRTSSFWRHLAETYYGGRYDFLEDYMDVADWHGNWIDWLRNRVELGTGNRLGMVYGGFLADYAGWGDPGFAGQFFGRREWLDQSFGGCEKVYLNKSEAVDYVEIDLLPFAGECFEVSVSALGEDGVQEGESAAVQIAAFIMAGKPLSREGLHLALAASSSKGDFHCASEVKRRGKRGVGKCLFIPDDGKLRIEGGLEDARLWNVVAQEKGDPEEARQASGERKGEINNLYTVGFAPFWADSRTTRYGGKDPITVRFYFILDVARITVDGQQKSGAVGSLGAGGADPQTTVPKRDNAGRQVNSFAKPDRFQPGLPVPVNPPPEAEGKLGYFSIATSADNADSSNAMTLMTGRQDASGRMEYHPLSVGETGQFPVLVSASIDGQPATSLPDALLVVEEFSDLVFRARYDVTLCRLSDLIPSRPGVQLENPCRNPFPASGEIVKAFAGSRLPGHYMVVERTEGTEMYRKANEQALDAWREAPSGSSYPREPGAAAGGSRAGGGALEPCTCSCDERSETLRRAEALKLATAAGDDPPAGALSGLMRCQSQCRAEYMTCVMAENRAGEAQEAAREAERLKQLQQECDCSCDTLHSLKDRTEALLREFQAGNTNALGEMDRIGQCMSVCQQAIMACAR